MYGGSQLGPYDAERPQSLHTSDRCRFSSLALYTEKTILPIPITINWDMIVVTVFLLILNQMEFQLVQN